MSLSATTDPLPNYSRARSKWPQAPALGQYYEDITRCLNGNVHGVAEHVKSFIECVCITILSEFGEPLPSSDPTSTQLLTAALKPLGLQNSRGASKLDKVLSAFNKLSDALSEMRNENGPIAHGKDGFIDALEDDHARAFLHTGDAIVGLLMNALEGKKPNFLFTREPYERFKHLCDRIDRSVRIEAEVEQDQRGSILVISLTVGGKAEAIELRIEPSRLLYGIDRTAFVGVLSYAPETIEEVESENDGDLDVQEAPEQPRPNNLSTQAQPLSVFVDEYSGLFANLREGLRRFLIGESIASEPSIELVNSLLATAEKNSGVDWLSREGLQARMKIGFRRVLFKAGVENADAPERLLMWLKVNAPDPTTQTV
jgi:hypothetical protein